LKKILSGGQTGVDLGGRRIIKKKKIEQLGWCPKGRREEDGVIDEKYNMRETLSENYSERTLLNIKDSDATLIIIPSNTPVNSIGDGTKLTIEQLNRNCKPYLIVEISHDHKFNIHINKVI